MLRVVLVCAPIVLLVTITIVAAFRSSNQRISFQPLHCGVSFGIHMKSRFEKNSLEMHGGHHHHHEHKHDQVPSISLLTELSNPKQFIKKPEGKVIAIASAFMLLSLFIKKRITRWDFVIFGSLTTTLSVFRAVKRTFWYWLSRIKVFKDGVLRHSRPIRVNSFIKNENAADRVTLLGIAINIFLSGIKFFGGIAFNSAVLIADAGHSLSDLFSDFITLWAVQIARIPPDSDHPYGHGKFESVGSLFLALTLLATGLSVGSWSYQKMLTVLTTPSATTSATAVTAVTSAVSTAAAAASAAVSYVSHTVIPHATSQPAIILAHLGHNSVGNSASAVSAAASAVSLPGWPALLIALVSILSKEWLFQITKRVGESLNSQILIANAWHHRSDSFSSVLSLLSIAAAIFLPGFQIADSAAGILIASMICLTGVEVLGESVKQLTDQSDEVLTEDIVAMVSRDVEGVDGVCTVRARRVGSGSLVDMSVLTPPKLSTSAAQEIAERTRWQVMEAFPAVLDVAVRTQGTGKICPLLSRNQRSTADVESDVRGVLLGSFEGQDLFGEIKRVTVHYVNSAALCVEVHMSMHSGSDECTVPQARNLARKMRLELLKDKDIIQADVLLDLTEEGDPLGGGAVVQYLREVK